MSHNEFSEIIFTDQLNQLHWQVFREGVDIIPISKETSTGVTAALLRYQPHASVPKHIHVGNEHIIVLSGSQSDEYGHYPAGSKITNLAGSSHSVKSESGCIVFITWEKPVNFI